MTTQTLHGLLKANNIDPLTFDADDFEKALRIIEYHTKDYDSANYYRVVDRIKSYVFGIEIYHHPVTQK